jgi:hypothetical protein
MAGPGFHNDLDMLEVAVGLYPIVTSQYSSITLCQVSYNIQYM